MRMSRLGILLALGMVASGCGVGAEALEEDSTFSTHGSALQAGPDFTGTYSDCDEFAGLGFVPLANVQPYVPDDFIVIEAGPGLALLVAQAGSCASIDVGEGAPRPGIFAQLGVAIVPPDGTGDGNFYQLMFASNHQRLAHHMKKAGANARFSPQLSYQLASDPDALEIHVPKPPHLGWSMGGPVVFPDPSSPPNPTTVFNYWHQSAKQGNVRQRNTVEGIRLGTGQEVQLTALGAELEAILGGPSLSFPIFSSPEVFDAAALDVEVDVF